MAPKIFITGGTGYIGGTVLDTIVKSHPDYEVTALLRNIPNNFASRYPEVQIVHGVYDSWDIVSEAASKADIVIRIKALIDGLLKTGKTSYLLHLSGTGIVADWRDPTYHGRLNPKVWSDVNDILEITSRDYDELHRNVDEIIQQAAREHGDKLKTAIVCPPDIYGPGRGPGRTQSVYFPMFYEDIKSIGAPFYGGEGSNTRSWVHIEDLMQVYLKLVESAVAGGGAADWGVEGYYFAASHEASQIDIAKKTGEILKKHGLCERAEPVALSLKQIHDETLLSRGEPGLGTYMFASNSRTISDRAVMRLGYKPSAPTLWDQLEADLLAAAK